MACIMIIMFGLWPSFASVGEARSVVGTCSVEHSHHGPSLVQFGRVTRKKSSSLVQAGVNDSFEAWKQEFHASLGDMCAHYTWDFGMVCRGPDGRANNNGMCRPPNYWDDGMDPSKPVHTGMTPCEAQKCWGKPAGGMGNEPFMSQEEGWKPCKPPDNQEEYEAAFAYGWKPPGENRSCVPICVNRKKKKSYRKVMCGAMSMARYRQGLRYGFAHCRRPARNCDFNDHVRDGFYRSVGFGKKCRESFNTSVYDTCASDPETSTNCEVEKSGKTWNVLNTCWDGAWDKVCKARHCFALKSLKDQKCVATCKSYGGDMYGPYEDCGDAWAAAGCPADGTSWNDPALCANSTEPPSAAETAAALAVAPGERDETLGVRVKREGKPTGPPAKPTGTPSEPSRPPAQPTGTPAETTGPPAKAECPDWCLHKRFGRFKWDLKCWTFKCQPCDDWVANCGEILKRGKTKTCAGWCKNLAKRKPQRMCMWVKCMGCEGWEGKCKP